MLPQTTRSADPPPSPPHPLTPSPLSPLKRGRCCPRPPDRQIPLRSLTLSWRFTTRRTPPPSPQSPEIGGTCNGTSTRTNRYSPFFGFLPPRCREDQEEGGVTTHAVRCEPSSLTEDRRSGSVCVYPRHYQSSIFMQADPVLQGSQSYRTAMTCPRGRSKCPLRAVR